MGLGTLLLPIAATGAFVVLVFALFYSLPLVLRGETAARALRRGRDLATAQPAPLLLLALALGVIALAVSVAGLAIAPWFG